MIKLLVTGDRNWNNIDLVANVLSDYIGTDVLLVNGYADGLDKIAHILAENFHIDVIAVPAHWRHSETCPKNCKEICGKPAGAIRNKKMYDNYSPFDEILAFHNDIQNSKGTKNMINYAISKGYTKIRPIKLYTEDSFKPQLIIKRLK